MNEFETQEPEELLDEEDYADEDYSPYYHCPAYPEFDGWRELVL